MVAITEIRAWNTSLKSQTPGHVSVFVGATSGIGHTTAIQLAKVTKAPKMYLIGRSQAKLGHLEEELRSINPDATIEVIVSETSLLEQVDVACKEILAKEKKVDLLFMTTGYLSLEQKFTSEGLDEVSSLRHYSRFRFIQQLLPLLRESPHPRVCSVLAAGNEGKLYTPDLSLKTNYSFILALEHFTTMQTLGLEALAKENPSISFLHIYPGIVDTGITQRFLNSLTGLMYYLGQVAAYLVFPVVLLFSGVPIERSGETMVYLATHPRYASKATIEGSDASLKGAKLMRCSVPNNGVYRVNSNGETFDDGKVLGPLRQDGWVGRVWEHTVETFDQASRG